ncbi:MAG: DUF4876 domain-containing protein [Candidatus Marinimicrobia bacterium]|nr:DUF4876 domain-containing protein [Candidatus Neomarinimicrobiota bacterium]
MKLRINLQNILILFFSFILIIGCLNNQKLPTTYDGTMDIILQVNFDIDSLNYKKYFSSIPVEISTYDYNNFSYIDSTDTNGIIEINNVPFAEYKVNINSEIFVDFGSFIDTMPVVASGTFTPNSSIDSIGTIEIISGGAEKGLKINELYTVGPPNTFFYFFDQYIELYNSSNETKYLDGIVVCRMSNTIDKITYIFQFPGTPLTGREYPVEPKEFVVLAGDAYDHKGEIFNGATSIDLSDADWEFRNSKDYGDWDNPDVPNIDNIEEGHTNDFYISLTSDVVIIADGSDVEYIDGLDSASIIDGVEYSSSPTHRKDIESFVDRGYGGVGLQKYSMQSLERKSAGFDTDNSAIDFEIISEPTIGYHHE